MNLVITVLCVLLSAYLFLLIARITRIPQVLVLILSGLALNIPWVKDLLIEPNTSFIFNLGDIALLVLMFLAGLESSWKLLLKEEKDSLFIGLFASITTLILATLVSFSLGFSIFAAVIVGIVLSITDEGTSAKYLMDINKLKTKAASAIMGAGIVDDIIGLILFMIVTFFLHQNHAMDDILIILSIIAFFAGAIVQARIKKQSHFFKYFEKFATYLIIPFFFASIALHFDMSSIKLSTIIISILLITALAGKIIGTLLTKKLSKFSIKQLYIIGWGMNSRGAIGMAIALMAFRSNLLSPEIYSSLIIITLITTILFPLAAGELIKKNPHIMG